MMALRRIAREAPLPTEPARRVKLMRRLRLAAVHTVAGIAASAAPVRLLVQNWREREALRRELSSMSGGDFGDLKIASSLMRDEARRWPWQQASPQWREAGSARRRDFPAD
jgi:hypothetical protein